jgi:tRNA-splicing endonuclease subunit Sen2
MTARRRLERKQFKLDRAKAIAAAAAEAEVAFAEGRVVDVALSGPTIPSASTWKPSSPSTPEERLPSAEDDAMDVTGLEDLEHLQLTLSEAFFLVWCLDCLSVIDPQTVFASHSPQ